MTASTHRIGGITAGITLAAMWHANIPESGLVIAGALLGSLLPDIDNRHSSISRKWEFISLFVSAGQFLIRVLANVLPGKPKQYIRSLIGHRGITHSLAATLIFPGLIYVIGISIDHTETMGLLAVGIAGGILSHLLFDMCSGGVPLFMPLTTKRITLMRIRTGGIGEWLFRGILLTMIVITVSVTMGGST